MAADEVFRSRFRDTSGNIEDIAIDKEENLSPESMRYREKYTQGRETARAFSNDRLIQEIRDSNQEQEKLNQESMDNHAKNAAYQDEFRARTGQPTSAEKGFIGGVMPIPTKRRY